VWERGIDFSRCSRNITISSLPEAPSQRKMPSQGLIEVVQLPRRILLRVSQWNDGDEGKWIGGGVRAPQLHAETDIEPAQCSGW
jgi:hypothetical protein